MRLGNPTPLNCNFFQLHPSYRFLFSTTTMYFSNHSQSSRFLAAPPQQSTQPTAAPAATTNAPRSSSKLFSTSVSAVERSKSTDSTSPSSSATGVVGVHPLRNTYVRSLTRVADVSCFDLSFLTVGSFGSDNNVRRVIKLLVTKRE